MLRGIACLLVVLMHVTRSFIKSYNSTFLGDIFQFGGSGVDIFFVLSGFIIAYSYKEYFSQPTSVVNFLKKRIIRIFPIYWIIITCFIILQLLLPSFYHTPFQINFLNFLKTYLLLPGHIMVNGVSWTLTYELFFYILFAIALFIRVKQYLLWLLCGYLIFLIVVANLPFSNVITANYTGLIVFPMNIEFLLGVIIVLIMRFFPRKMCLIFLAAGIFLFIISAILTDKDIILFPVILNRVVLFGIPSFIIILSLAKYELTSYVNIQNIFLELGNASYSIYLFHLPLVNAFFAILVKLHIFSYPIIVLLSIFMIALICFAGILLYKKVENPLIKRLNKIFL